MPISVGLADALAGRYQIDREIGSGGMATVYLARDVRHDRDVAVKVLHPELGAAIGGERFLAEIKTTAKLQHPHILPLLDSGQIDGSLYYVMPFIAGDTLRGRITREGQLPIEDALQIARDVADALGAAHALGIIHRDIKPENILLQGTHALVADFGIALAVQQAGGARMTQTGLSLGTPQYMSPEQAMGERQIDLRADLYALGAVTYEMLVGNPPFTGTSVQAIVARAMTERPSSLRTVRDTIPPGVEAAVLKALAKLPADRFGSTAAYAEALASGLTIAPVVSGRASRTSARRSTRLWQGVALVASAVAVALAFVPRSPGVRSVLMQRQLTYEGSVIGTAISPDGLWIAWLQDDCSVADLDACTSTLQVREVDGVQSVHILTWQRIANDLHWSGDGKTLVFRGAERGGAEHVYLVDRLGGTPRQIGVTPTAMTVLPDGHTLAVAVDGVGGQWIQRYDIVSLALVDSVRLPPQVSLVDMSASPTDGTLAASAVFGSLMHRLALIGRDGSLLDSIYVASRDVVRWDSTGTALLAFDDGEAGSPADDLLRIPVRDHHFDRQARPITVLGQITTGWDAGHLDVSRTGRVVIVNGTSERDVRVGALGAPPESWRSIRPGSTRIWGKVAFAPDGRSVAAGASDNLAENLYSFPTSGSARPRALTSYHGGFAPGGHWAQDASYSPDGAHIVFNRGTSASVDIVFTDSAGGRERRIAGGGLAAQSRPDWLSNDLVVTYRNNAFVAIDTTGTPRDSVRVPDSIGHGENGLANPRDRSMYFVARDLSIAAADFRTHAIRTVARAPFALTLVGWDATGALLVTDATFNTTNVAYKARKESVFRVNTDGTLTLMGKVPYHCLEVTIDRSGLTLACSQVSIGGDVMLAVATSGS
jgi:Tol biopolymer transport system component